MHALTRDIEPSDQNPKVDRATLPLAIASLGLVMAMNAVVALGVSMVVYSPLGIDLLWAFGRSLCGSDGLVSGQQFSWFSLLATSPLYWYGDTWRRVTEEVREILDNIVNLNCSGSVEFIPTKGRVNHAASSSLGSRRGR